LYRILVLFFLITYANVYSQSKSNQLLDSIYYYRKASRDNSIDYSKKLELANKAILLSKKLAQDTTLLKSEKNLSFLYLKNKNYEDLKFLNFKIRGLAKKVKDTIAIANANYLLGFTYIKSTKSDSAYYHYYRAAKLFKSVKANDRLVEVLYAMADLQHDKRDYIGSEINAINAIRILEKLPENEVNSDYLWA